LSIGAPPWSADIEVIEARTRETEMEKVLSSCLQSANLFECLAASPTAASSQVHGRRPISPATTIGERIMRIADSLRRRLGARPRREQSRADTLDSLSPREWADLPAWHPAQDTPAR
jgi:hypothetical protein